MPQRNIRFSHVGFHVRDLDAMVAFYCPHLGLQVTDRGPLTALSGEPEICFLRADPNEHHQVALVEGGGQEKGMLNQGTPSASTSGPMASRFAWPMDAASMAMPSWVPTGSSPRPANRSPAKPRPT